MENLLDIILRAENLLGREFVYKVFFSEVRKSWEDKDNEKIDAEISAYLF